MRLAPKTRRQVIRVQEPGVETSGRKLTAGMIVITKRQGWHEPLGKTAGIPLLSSFSSENLRSFYFY